MTGDKLRKVYAYNVQYRAMLKEIKQKKELALLVGVSEASINGVFSGTRRFIDPEVMVALATFFVCTPGELLNVSPELEALATW